MADPKIETGTENEDEVALKAELEADGEVLGDDDKPLPWNHPKRVRQIYKDAKAGKQAVRALTDLGLKPSDTAKLKADLSRLEQYDAAYAEWQEQQEKGKTTPDEDAEAAEARKVAEKVRKQLKALKVKFEDDDEPDKEAAKEAEANRVNITRQSFAKINDALEDAGYDLDKMDPADRKDLVAEIDFKVGQKLMRNEEARQTVLAGSLRPIEKMIKEVLESMGSKPRKPIGTGITKLPPRGSSSTGSSGPRKAEVTEPKNTKEATAQMVADLAERRRAAAKGD